MASSASSHGICQTAIANPVRLNLFRLSKSSDVRLRIGARSNVYLPQVQEYATTMGIGRKVYRGLATVERERRPNGCSHHELYRLSRTICPAETSQRIQDPEVLLP